MKKKKNTLNKNTNIVVKFYPSTDQEIDELLNSLNISGLRVSNLIPRWSIDVPFWKEDYYIEKLLESELVEKIYSNPSRKRFSSDYEENLESESDEQ